MSKKTEGLPGWWPVHTRYGLEWRRDGVGEAQQFRTGRWTAALLHRGARLGLGRRFTSALAAMQRVEDAREEAEAEEVELHVHVDPKEHS